MTPGDYIFTGGYFAGGVAMLWLHYARKATRMGCKDSWLPWRAIRQLRESRNPADQMAYYAGHNGFDVDPLLLEQMRSYCDEPVLAEYFPPPPKFRVQIPALIDAPTESTATLANHSPANADAHTALDDADAATRPPGDQQHPSASASGAVAMDGAATDAAPHGSERQAVNAAADYILKHHQQLDQVRVLALLAAIGGKGCIDAFYRRGL